MHKVHPQAKQEIDKYIKSLPEVSKKICNTLRKIILQADKELIEDWKWGPHYYAEGMVCGFSAFKNHTKLTFFNGSGMSDKKGLFNHCVDNDFSRSIKFTDISEIKEKDLLVYVKESIKVNRKGYKRVVTDKNVEVPEDLLAALKKDKIANSYFENLSYGYKKDYVEHVTSAKREQTRQQRIEKVVDQCSQQKTLHDKYKN